MLYLHCGWPKTGTTTLQAALVAHRDRLAAAGTVYPKKWTQERDDSHRLFADERGVEAAIEGFEAFLKAHAGEDVVISSEVLSLRLFRGALQETLTRLIAAAQGVMPVRCIWTVRRFDDTVHSVCVQRAIAGLEWSPECVARVDPGHLFAGMRAMEDAADETLYIRYDAESSYQSELLRSIGVPAAAAETIHREMAASPRLNTSQSHKQLAVLLNLESLSARCGTPLDTRRLREIFDQGRFQFAGDRRADLFEAAARRELHAKALAAAREHGISAYERFFGEAEIGPSQLPLSGDPSSVSDDDLRQLSAEDAPVRP